MKKTFINLLVAATILFLAGCEKNKDYTATFDRVAPTNSLLKVIYASAYSLNPLVQLSIDDVRVSGLITGRTPFPGGGYNTSGSNFPDYLALAPGNKKLSVAIPKRGTNVDSIVLFSTQITLENAKNYTLNISDTLAKTKALLVVDSVEQPAAGTVKYRFVNLMPNVPKIDLYYNSLRVATSVPYNTEGVVFSTPVFIAGTWSIRETGTLPTSTALATFATGSTIANQRMFTAFAMGYKGSTTTTLRPYISFTINF